MYQLHVLAQIIYHLATLPIGYIRFGSLSLVSHLSFS